MNDDELIAYLETRDKMLLHGQACHLAAARIRALITERDIANRMLGPVTHQRDLLAEDNARLREALDWIRIYEPETVIAAEVKFAFNRGAWEAAP